jgi:hypothetical protein
MTALHRLVMIVESMGEESCSLQPVEFFSRWHPLSFRDPVSEATFQIKQKGPESVSVMSVSSRGIESAESQ